MRRFRTLLTGSLLLNVSFLLSVSSAAAQGQPDDGKLKSSAPLVREHVKEILKKLPQAEQQFGRRIAEQAKSDSRAKTYTTSSGSAEGAREHPWKKNGNPMSMLDWIVDSALIKQYNAINAMNWPNMYGCYDFGLLSHSYKSDFSDYESFGAPEGIACQSYCLLSSILACPAHAPPYIIPFGANDNGAETAMYWLPEYQVATNNYGINRVEPGSLGQPKYTRSALIGAKKGNDKQKAQQAGQTYPFDGGSFQNDPDLEKDPFYGNGWAGFYFPDFQEKRYAHVYRTQFSVEKSDLKKNTQEGWQPNPAYSLLDSFPKKSSEHPKANVWTEYGMFDLVTGIPQMSYRIYGGIGGGIMNAMFGGQKQISEAAKEDPPFWKSKGAMAYRVGKWPDIYGDLKELYKIKGDSNAMLKEAVYKGGYELYPLVSNMSGFGAPTLAAAAVIARRGFYIAGENMMMMPHYPTPTSRIVQYTIDAGDKSREIDKLMRLRPLKDFLKTSECFRSQNIPNMVNKDKSLETWAEQNLPRDLLRYTMDPDLINIQGNDASFVYWNRRITCHCRYCGLVTGSIILNDGDKLYDQRKFPFCTYPMGSSFSAWQGFDTYNKCIKGGPPAETFFRGMQDAV